MSKKKAPEVNDLDEGLTVKEFLRLSRVTGGYADWQLEEDVSEGLLDFLRKKKPQRLTQTGTKTTADRPKGIEGVKGAGEVKDSTPYAKTKEGKRVAGRAVNWDVERRHARRVEDDDLKSLDNPRAHVLIDHDDASDEMSDVMANMRRIAGMSEVVDSTKLRSPKTSSYTAMRKPTPSAPAEKPEKPGTMAAAHAAMGPKKIKSKEMDKIENVEDVDFERQRLYAGITRTQTWEEAIDEVEESTGMQKARREYGSTGAQVQSKITNRKERHAARRAVKLGKFDTLSRKSRKADPYNAG